MVREGIHVNVYMKGIRGAACALLGTVLSRCWASVGVTGHRRAVHGAGILLGYKYRGLFAVLSESVTLQYRD